jgi:hypothetical protein
MVQILAVASPEPAREKVLKDLDPNSPSKNASSLLTCCYQVRLDRVPAAHENLTGVARQGDVRSQGDRRLVIVDLRLQDDGGLRRLGLLHLLDFLLVGVRLDPTHSDSSLAATDESLASVGAEEAEVA